MARFLALFVAAVAAALFLSASESGTPVLAQGAEIVVTSTSDAPDPEVECPHETACTLRRAIETANAEPGSGEVRITFDTGEFAAAEPGVIVVQGAPLPAVTRDSVTIDGAGAVVIDGSELGAEANGLTFLGDSATLRGVTVDGFGGSCLVISGPGSTVGGDRTTGGGNQLGNCKTGALLTSEGTLLRGNIVGIIDGEAAPVTTAVSVEANGIAVGGLDLDPALANVIGNADDGVVVDEGVKDTLIAGNWFGVGADANETSAPLQRAVTVMPAAAGTRITQNLLSSASQSAVALPAASVGIESSRTTIRDNEYRSLAGIEIDIGADGMRNTNDNADPDSGPNGRLNHPVITRPTQAVIDGIACGGCAIELYRAEHWPGGQDDFAAELVATTIALPSGAFSFVSPPVTPGEWVSASATDTDGNTSEFSAATRVGVGAIQCGNIGLLAGWNHTGYFGASAVLLGETFPGDPGGLVAAVYELGPDGSYTHWFRDTPVGRTLTTLVPGRAYWFLLDAPLVLHDGFSLTAPLGVRLEAGLNSFTYFGASGDVRDAFSSLLDSAPEVWQWIADASGGAWHSWGTAGTPGWARDFAVVNACGAYLVAVDSAVVLEPLHP